MKPKVEQWWWSSLGIGPLVVSIDRQNTYRSTICTVPEYLLTCQQKAQKLDYDDTKHDQEWPFRRIGIEEHNMRRQPAQTAICEYIGRRNVENT